MADKKSIFDAVRNNNVGGDAKLKVNQAAAPATERRTRAKTIKAINEELFEAHARLVKKNKTNLDVSNYMKEAFREKLERDGAFEE
ncbi:chaperonin [Citrobacter sp. Cu231]|uniref:chaperonin n=1 Tax=Citrobacter sp. Cu231 TaxID=2985159 RepID=UPI0025787953|nr:chaperonin [Citrobacter sp. Cu231]MDM2743190.1 chaperonin [Citrobacter sp. Cu231]